MSFSVSRNRAFRSFSAIAFSIPACVVICNPAGETAVPKRPRGTEARKAPTQRPRESLHMLVVAKACDVCLERKCHRTGERHAGLAACRCGSFQFGRMKWQV